LVKLFPAATVGPGYWRRLAAPLGESLPFCIAAGGLGPADVMTWLEAGVDAVALGSSLTAAAAKASAAPDHHAGLRAILSSLSR
jgi:2-dehydro-3-deoxyphosphogluconate aldolase/(4S)-4-hydroxy-2-oxoglutarate aldolase